MSLKEFITKYIPLSISIAVFDNISNEQYFEGKARDLYNSDDSVLCREVAEIEPDYNYAGWIIISVY